MGIESTSEVWESTKPLVGRSLRSCGQGVREGVAKRHGQDGSFGALQPPATNLTDSQGLSDDGQEALLLFGKDLGKKSLLTR